MATALMTTVIAFLMPSQTFLISVPAFCMIGPTTFMTELMTFLIASKATLRTFCMVFDRVAISTTFSTSGASRDSNWPTRLPFIDLLSPFMPLDALSAPDLNFPTWVPLF